MPEPSILTSKDRVQVIEADLRPSFKPFATGAELLPIEKFELSDWAFVRLDVVRFKIEYVHDAEVHRSYFVAIVVD